MTIIRKSKTTKKSPIIKTPAINKFERMFKEIQIQPNKNSDFDFPHDKQSTWIVSDNNSTFKSFINHG